MNKNMNSSKNSNKRFSISIEFTLIFISLMMGVVLLCLIINHLFLRSVYEHEKVKVIRNAYENIIAEGGYYSSEEVLTNDELDEIARVYNVAILAVNADEEIVYSSYNSDGFVLRHLIRYMQGEENSADFRLVESEDSYIIRHAKRNDREYIELVGDFDDQVYFMMRTPFSSITEAARIANRFFIYVSIVVIILGGFIILVVTKKLTKPIEELNTISTRMVDLDFDAKYTGDQKNEIGELGRNVNKLSYALEKSITELKNANLELKKDIEKKEALDEMRMEFISNVSHELKTPIAIIQGYAEGLKEGVSEDSESKDFYCDVIVDEASKMNSMVKKFLALNQLEYGGEEINLERFDITNMIESYLSSASMLAISENIEIKFDEKTHYTVWADEYKAEEVLTNYFSNAVHYCKSDSNGDKYIEVSIQKKENSVRICVFNTGDNIPEESMDRLWEKFYKVDKARTREYGGSGVGLSIVKAIQDSINMPYGALNMPGGVMFWYELDNVV